MTWGGFAFLWAAHRLLRLLRKANISMQSKRSEQIHPANSGLESMHAPLKGRRRVVRFYDGSVWRALPPYSIHCRRTHLVSPGLSLKRGRLARVCCDLTIDTAFSKQFGIELAKVSVSSGISSSARLFG